MVRLALLLLCVLLCQCGCFIPVGSNESTYPALAGGGGAPAVFIPGVTTRAEVQSRLGQPVWRWDDDAIWEYVEHPPKSVWFAPTLVGHGAPSRDDGTHYLFLRFAPGGVLHDYEVLLQPDDPTHNAELRRFRSGADPATAPALQLGQRLTYGPPFKHLAP